MTKKIISYITPAGGNVFADLGFPPEEAERLKRETDKEISDELLRKSVDSIRHELFQIKTLLVIAIILFAMLVIFL